MKRLTWTVFVAFWTAAATLVAAGALAPSPGRGDEPVRTITAAELSRHASAERCWKAIRGKVYDLTDYIAKHPTPSSVMLRWCGKEATEAYETKGYGRPHSAAADAMLEAYYIGDLED